MPYVQTTNPKVYRDTESRGLVIADETALLKARAERSAAKRVAQISQQRQDYETRFSMMSDRLDRCESLLQELVQHMTTLVARSANSVSESRE